MLSQRVAIWLEVLVALSLIYSDQLRFCLSTFRFVSKGKRRVSPESYLDPFPTGREPQTIT